MTDEGVRGYGMLPAPTPTRVGPQACKASETRCWTVCGRRWVKPFFQATAPGIVETSGASRGGPKPPALRPVLCSAVYVVLVLVVTLCGSRITHGVGPGGARLC